MRSKAKLETTAVSRRTFAGMLGMAGLGAAGLAPLPAAAAAPVSERTRGLQKPTGYSWHWFRGRPQSAHGRNGMVVATRGGRPVQDAVEMLRQGGNAMDAALSLAMAQVVYALGNWVSMAGLFTLAYYEAASGKVYSLNAGYNTVQKETDPLTIPKSGVIDPSKPEFVTDGRVVLVPGFFAGIQAAHDRFGHTPFARLFDSAIGLAEDGIYVTKDCARFLTKHRAHLARLPATKAIFTKANGGYYEEGDTFVQPVLAKTLRTLSKRGAEYMYRGEWAQRFVAGVQADGGKMTLKDLADYRVEWADPIHMRYKGHDVYAHHQAHSSLGMLGLAQEADLASLGRYYESPETFYWFHKIFRATGTNMDILGDRASQRTVAPEDWLNPAKLAEIWQRVRANQFPDAGRDLAPHHSDAIVAADHAGNVVTLTHSTNTGNTGLYVDGISIPGAAAIQQAHIAKVGPGKRLPIFIPNTIVLKAGKPVMATSAIGVALHQETVKVITNVVDYGASAREALEAASFCEPDFSPDGVSAEAETVLTDDYPVELLDAVRAKGMPVEELVFNPDDATQVKKTRTPGIGVVPTLVVDSRTGEYEGVSPRIMGGALGY